MSKINSQFFFFLSRKIKREIPIQKIDPDQVTFFFTVFMKILQVI